MSEPLNLSYETPREFATVMPTPFHVFHARGYVGWKGDRLFRIFLQPDKIYFIKVGGQRRANAAAGAQFGLLGALVMVWMQKRDKKKVEQKISQISQVPPEQLMAEAKENFTLDYSAVRSPQIKPRGFFSNPIGSWFFVNEKGKKKTYTFDDVPAMQAAVKELTARFGKDIAVNVVWNEKKNRFDKKPV